MEYWVFVVLLIVIFFILFQNMTNIETNEIDSREHMYSGSLTQLVSRGPEDLYLTVNTEKYVPEYNYRYDCRNSPYCYKNRWYNSTPFVWNNPTRWPKMPYYTYIHNWYRDTYSEPYWFWNY